MNHSDHNVKRCPSKGFDQTTITPKGVNGILTRSKHTSPHVGCYPLPCADKGAGRQGNTQPFAVYRAHTRSYTDNY